MRVHPKDDQVCDASSPTTPWRGSFWSVSLGLAYVALSVTCSIVYLTLLQPAFSNDLWWSQFSPSYHQALLVDLINDQLATRAAGDVDLLAPRAAVAKTYDPAIASTADVYSTYARRLALAELTSLTYAVANLRTLTASWCTSTVTQYCWVDLARDFEIAHTIGRQTRCLARYRTNGAVYLETMLRNQIWDDFMQRYGGDDGAFTVAIQLWLTQVPAGVEWLTQTSAARATTSIDQEVAHWLSYNLTTFTLQWQNQWSTGIAETMVVSNALGLAQSVTLKHVPRTNEAWTGIILYFLLLNDLYAMQSVNRSLIRSADNSFSQPPETISFEDMLCLTDDNGNYANQVEAFRVQVGPFNSIDTYYVSVPPAVVALYDTFQTAYFVSVDENHKVQSQAMQHRRTALSDVALVPTPTAWLDPTRLYYGGNPMCLFGGPQPFVQETFGFNDACLSQLPLTVSLTPMSSVFAALVLGSSLDVDATCALTAPPVASCDDTLVAVVQVTRDMATVATALTPLVQSAADAIASTTVSLMQFATASDGTNWTVLRHPLLQDQEWAFFGWTFVYDWVQGKREVVSFEGDVSSLVLVSTAYSPHLVASSATAVCAATKYIYYLVVYVSAVLTLVAMACLLCAIIAVRGSVHAPNLMWFNRVVGSIWIGRPLLVVRGVTAMLLLSTSPLQPTQSNPSFLTRFTLIPRAWPETLIVAGEATWTLYVVHDFLTVVNVFGLTTTSCGPVSSWLAWAVLAGLDMLCPVQPTVTLHRQCTALDMDQSIDCSSGRLSIGSVDRLVLVVAVQVAALVLSIGIMWGYRHKSRCVVEQYGQQPRHVLGVAAVYLAPMPKVMGDGPHMLWSMDKVSCLMAGLVVLEWPGNFQTYTFDVKVWALHHHDTSPGLDRGTHKQTCPTTTDVSSLQHRLSTIASVAIQNMGRHGMWRFLLATWGVCFAMASIASSISYLSVSNLALANDLFWMSFNMTGSHRFVANWLNRQLVLDAFNNITLKLNLDSINQDNDVSSQTSGGTSVQSATNYGALMQYSELITLEPAIQGLRSMNGCLAPWIFTQYCFVDFNQQWEMANSATRQMRCQAMTSNGAVFLEAVIRNIDVRTFTECWGLGFDMAIATELRRTQAGQAWLTNVQSSDQLSIADEATRWRTMYGIRHFKTQWQNFKKIGLVNTYAVVNMFGLTYPFTLQHQNASFRMDKQSTFKMYWGLANDLMAVASNATSMGGRSLVRVSPDFAFANATSLESVLVQNGTLSMPLDAVSLLQQSTVLGPFGSIDTHVLPCPSEAKAAVRLALTLLRQTLYHSTEAQTTYGQFNFEASLVSPAPKAWTDMAILSVAGSLLCPGARLSLVSPISGGMVSLTSWEQNCAPFPLWSNYAPTQETMVMSAMLSSLSHETIPATCGQSVQNQQACIVSLTQTVSFVLGYVAQVDFDVVVAAADTATAAIRGMNVSFVQFGLLNDDTMQFFQLDVLDPTQVEFTFFAWLVLVDWTLGLREAISFEGDVGSVAVITEFQYPLQQPVNHGEFPVTLSFYMRGIVFYVTYAVITIATLALVYIFFCHGYVEVLNLFFLERVGAIVWVGRPLLFVRSLTAIGLLSTSSLALHSTGHITYFEDAHPPLLTTLLAANEVAWLVAISNDILMVFTQAFTAKYAGWDGVVACIATAIFSLMWPVVHEIEIDKQCHMAQVDFQIVCTSGVITIGYIRRLVIVVGIVLGSTVATFVVAWIWHRGRPARRRPRPLPSSIFLYSGAKYLFYKSRWRHDDVYYMDRMSAVLNGIVTLRHDSVIYGLDVKLWRTFQVQLPKIVISDVAFIQRAQHALPIVPPEHEA
ncbi:Aste57867_22790 [Aphanomyces stellatus]|uniref:Aste57867_22790 protein n=1 Tax=Aphanomyces stellatus TaxID=120398 RepID=A0A485LL34_9STRA|nr:hypothetical protein As57867_022720 [Aphanomyces stellatus]VFT99443.1 Aste57867_22790 [Aphanomyces stellatus]